MAAPEYVPRPPDEVARVYGSPPWRPESWTAARPADLLARQPLGQRLGRPGPDQGYVLRLARQFEGTLVLVEGESEVDAVAGCVGVALKRASIFGRAPVIHDLTIAFTVWGFLGPASDDLVACRRLLFEEVANPHHYEEARGLVDLVPESTLRMSPDEVRELAARDWTRLVARPDDVPPLAAMDVVAAVHVMTEPQASPEPVASEPEPLPTWTPPPRPEPSAPAAAPPLEPALRPATKAAPPPATPQRPAAKKKVVKKKVIKKVIKKKVVKKKAVDDGSLFARPEGESSETPDEAARRRASDLGTDT